MFNICKFTTEWWQITYSIILTFSSPRYRNIFALVLFRSSSLMSCSWVYSFSFSSLESLFSPTQAFITNWEKLAVSLPTVAGSSYSSYFHSYMSLHKYVKMCHIKRFAFLQSVFFGTSSSLTFGQLREKLYGPLGLWLRRNFSRDSDLKPHLYTEVTDFFFWHP